MTSAILVSLVVWGLLAAPVTIVTRNLDLTPAVVALRGSLGAGEAVLTGGYRLRWTSRIGWVWLPHLVTDLTLEGADTRLTGALRSGAGGVAIAGLTGRAGPGLAQVAGQGLACDMTARVDDVALGWGWRRVTASGRVTTPAGRCEGPGLSSPLRLPPLAPTLTQAGRDARMDLAGDPGAVLATVLIRRDRLLDITVEPAAADVVPGLPRSGPIALTLPF